MKAIKIKIDSSLDFVHDLLCKDGFHDFESTDRNPDFIISETIPNESKLFVVIWDKHDIKAIEKISRERHKYLRGYFIKDEVRSSPLQLIETLTDISKELSFIADLKKADDEIKSRQEYVEIGKYVKIGKQSKQSKELENYFSRPRFTSLFIDRPMLQMMSKLTRILEDMGPALQVLENHYGEWIEKIRGNNALNSKNEFDAKIIDGLYKAKDDTPLRIEPILLTGDTGVGKTLIARWIHEQAGLKGSFQEINSSGLSHTLLESELFGHVKGAFTDAKQDKPGKAFLALGGVLFLDEVGDMPLDLQARVMKFIEEKTFTPDGWYRVTPFYTPLLVVAATNKDLREEVQKSAFRKDFYARLRHRVHVPSIEERKGSLNAIIDFVLQNPMVNGQGKIKYISREALDKFKSLKYEENFRGLERIVRDAAYKTRDYGLDIILAEAIISD